MDNLLNTIRSYDFHGYLTLYTYGQSDPRAAAFFYFFARFGIVFFFLSFIYLIWKKKINAFLCAFLAMGIAGLVDLVIYLFWRRPSPFISHSDLATPVIAGLHLEDNISFPSSHTYIVFAIAISVFLYGHRKLGSILFVLAVLVAIGRVGAGLHYPSDVIGGAILGLISGAVAFLIFRKAEKNWN